MAVTKITWENKTGIQNDASVARKNKVVDEDMNEIKQVVNNNADEVTTMQETIEDLQEGQGTSDTDITNLKNRVTTLEKDNTENKSNISSLQEQFSNFENYDDTEIKQDISEIKQEQQTQNSDIENLQTNDSKQDELISKLKNVALNAETEESKSIHVEDASTIGQLEVLGNHEQENRSGKNLFKLPDSGNNNGITYTNNGDGTFNISGTATEQASFSIVVPLENSGFEQGKNYTISSNIEIGNVAYYVHSATSDGYWNKTLLDFRYETTKTKVMPEPSTDYISLNIVVPKDVTLNYQNVTVQIEEGTVATEYEQYGASPSPEYPSPVKCLGSNKNIYDDSTSATNQRLSTGSGGTYAQTGYSVSGYIEILPNQYLIINTNYDSYYCFYNAERQYVSGDSFKSNKRIKSSKNVKYIKFDFKTEDKEKIKVEYGSEPTIFSPVGQGSTLISKINKNFLDCSKIGSIAAQNGIMIDDDGYVYSNTPNSDYRSWNYESSNWFITLEADTYTLSLDWNTLPTNGATGIAIQKSDNSKIFIKTTLEDFIKQKEIQFTLDEKTEIGIELKVFDVKFRLQLEKGTKATPIVEHQQEDYLLYIQQEMLPGDCFVKESDGRKELHNWNKLILNGTETVERVGTRVSGKYRFAITVSGIQTGNFADTEIVDNLISNELTVVSNNITWNCAEDNVMHIRINNTPQIIIYIEKCSQMTVDEFKAFLQELYDEGKAIEIYYKLATPTKLPCTKEQSAVLEELNNLDLFERVNNIITAENIALLKLKYALDVETYIDNKLNTINQQILNIAGGN